MEEKGKELHNPKRHTSAKVLNLLRKSEISFSGIFECKGDYIEIRLEVSL